MIGGIVEDGGDVDSDEVSVEDDEVSCLVGDCCGSASSVEGGVGVGVK